MTTPPPTPPSSPPSPPPAGKTASASALPIATVRRGRRWSFYWLLPPLAFAVAAVLGYHAWMVRGPEISVALADGYGVKAGDKVRYRGIEVGEVSGVRLRDDGAGVRVELTLTDDARGCARAGSLFWVVRPRVGIAGISGLDTLVGSRYLEVLPGAGSPQRSFIGLDEPPVPEALQDGALDLTVQADRKGSLRPGVPIMFRQIQVGSVLSVGLASDASAVEARLRVRREYARLVRTTSKFWDAGGFEINAGLTGVDIRLSSLEALATGAIAFATPQEGGAAVSTGHRFTLHAKPEDAWLQWKPSLSLDRDPNARDLALPRPVRATLAWDEERWWWDHGQRRSGWALVIAGGLVAPSELLTAPGHAKKGTLGLEVAGARYPLETTPTWSHDGIALLPVSPEVTPWPSERIRAPAKVEDLVLVGDPGDPPIPVAAARLVADDGHWTIDPSFSFAPGWHGAAVVAASDGKLIGILLVHDGQGVIALWK